MWLHFEHLSFREAQDLHSNQLSNQAINNEGDADLPPAGIAFDSLYLTASCIRSVSNVDNSTVLLLNVSWYKPVDF